MGARDGRAWVTYHVCCYHERKQAAAHVVGRSSEVRLPVKYVKVPESMEPTFERAEALVRGFFSARRQVPELGTIEVRGERYVSLRAKALSVEFFHQVRSLYGHGRGAEADEFSRHLLFDLAHAVGRSDAAHFANAMDVHDPMELLAAGPVGFAWAGWAKVSIYPESTPGDDFFLSYEHQRSFEGESWARDGELASEPVCIMNAGYSSGWCGEAFSVELVAVEVLCRGCGDDRCQFIMAPPDRIEHHLTAFRRTHARASDGVIPSFLMRTRIQDDLLASRVELAEQVKARTRELTEANERLRAEMLRRERVEHQLLQSQKLEALGRLAGGVAHDFNNLLSVIMGRAELLGMTLDSGSKQGAHATSIVAACERGAQLTRQLMSFSQDQLSQPIALDLSEVVSRSASFVASLVGEDIEVAVEGLDDVVVLADKAQLDQVVINLASNAREAMPTGGSLTFEILQEEIAADGVPGLSPGSYGVLRVTDTGEGMARDTLARAFDPFFTTRSKNGGTGLGLSIVHAIAARHHGAVIADSQRDIGSTISVYFPISERRVQLTPGFAPQRQVLPSNQSRTVLLVEDEGPLRTMLQAAMSRWGYTVLAAADADKALAALDAFSGPVHLVLTDVVMPGMGGRDLVDLVLSRHPEIEVVFMSGYTDDELLRRGIEHRDVRFLQKPFRLT
ncbi:MAG: two-component system cell cycle sensor histidine kinase/response regulator CckA, partial [Kiritimatiellia bacterium]